MKLTKFDAIILVGMVVAFAAFFLVEPAPSEQSAAADQTNKESPTTALTAALEPSPTPTNASPQPIDAESVSTVTVTSEPLRYHGQSVCIRGFYQQSFEFSALGTKRPPESIAPPLIWTEAKILGQELTCSTTDAGQEVCRGEVTVCGVFEYSAVPIFGHLGAYQYQLRPTTNH
jgi:hypothetical protein